MINFKLYKVGGKDTHDNDIIFIHHLEDNYAIYETNNFVLFWDDNLKGIGNVNISKVSSKIQTINGLNPGNRGRKLNSKIALIIRECMEGNPDTANEIADKVIKELMINLKLLYLLGSFIVISIVGIILMAMAFGNCQLDLIISIFFGSLGGLISVLLSFSKIEPEHFTGLINFVSGVIRVFVAGCSGLLCFYALGAGLIFSFIKDLNEDMSFGFIILVCFLSGFSERFIPDLLSQLQSKGDPAQKL